jgi:hypothetical protein
MPQSIYDISVEIHSWQSAQLSVFNPNIIGPFYLEFFNLHHCGATIVILMLFTIHFAFLLLVSMMSCR